MKFQFRLFSNSAIASWKQLRVVAAGESFQVEANGKLLQSVLNKPLCFPSVHFAYLFAEEWAIAGQDPKTIVNSPVTMATQRAHLLWGKEEARQECIQECCKFLQTDTVLFWTQQQEEDSLLRQRQVQQWKRLIDWINEKFAFDSEALLTFTDTLKSPVSASQMQAFAEWLHQLSHWTLAGFELATKITKSAIIATAMHEGRLDSGDAFRLSQLEEHYQMEKWGKIPELHEVAQADYQRLMALANVMMHQA